MIETKKDYNEAFKRYEVVKHSIKGSAEHKEKMLLVTLIEQYEAKRYKSTELDPIEFIKIRMHDLNLKPSDLAKNYGDKGTVSKVLNYKQALSLTMIRVFSKLLNIPLDCLIKEYKLKQ